MVNSALSRLNLICRGMDELEAIGAQIIEFAEGTPVWIFNGEMGAGKTTLIKAIASVLKVEDAVSSPTYSLVNEYRTYEGRTVYHFDFYRIDDEEEAEDIGLHEYLYSGNLCLIEWPSKIENLLPENNYMEIIIKADSDQTRHIELIKHV